MRKYLFIVAMIVLCAFSAAYGGSMKYTKIFDATALIASANSTSAVIDMMTNQIDGYFSLQLAVTGDGTVKVEYEASNDGTTYRIPEGVTTIVSGITKTSGPSADGKIIEQFEVELCRFIRFKVSETSGASAVTVTGHLIAK